MLETEKKSEVCAMAPIFCYILSVLIGYLLGSLSPSWLLSHRKKVDFRHKGTGNLGASNAMILLGWKWGILVALLDIGKAALAVWLCSRLFPDLPLCRVVAGSAAVLGHLYPFYLRFRGGKGFASCWGMILGLNWRFALVLVLVCAVLILITDYMVVGTVITSVSYPLYCLATHQLIAALILLLVSAQILWKHRENFVRLRNGTEIGLRRAHRGDLRVKK